MLLADENAGELSGTDEVVAIIFSFLPPVEIMCLRTALPNLQQLSIRNLDQGHKYSDGEDPDEERAAITDGWISHDIDIISRFHKLRILDIYEAPLNGRYPALNFPLLQKLTIRYCSYLKWDLEMLEGLPSLKVLDCNGNPNLTVSLSSLRVLKDTLERVQIIECRHVEGNLMDLADFPRLKELDLTLISVTGDIRDISEHDFPSLESLVLPTTMVDIAMSFSTLLKCRVSYRQSTAF